MSIERSVQNLQGQESHHGLTPTPSEAAVLWQKTGGQVYLNRLEESGRVSVQLRWRTLKGGMWLEEANYKSVLTFQYLVIWTGVS